MPHPDGQLPIKPLALTDSQMDTILQAAAVLHPPDRSPFLEAVAEQLRGLEPLGDGIVSRTVRQVQGGFFHPPGSADLLAQPRKYGRGR